MRCCCGKYELGGEDRYRVNDTIHAALGSFCGSVRSHEIADLKADLKEKDAKVERLESRGIEGMQHEIAKLEAENAEKDAIIKVLAQDLNEIENDYCADNDHPSRFHTTKECIEWATNKVTTGGKV